MEEKDFLVVVRIKNNRILSAMKRRKIKNFSELARLSMCAPTILGQLVSFKKSPLRRDGEWRRAAMNISSALHVEPEDLWPEYMARMLALKASVEMPVDLADLKLLNSEKSVLIKDAISKSLLKLTDRERDIITKRFGLDGQPIMTRNDIGTEYLRSAHGIAQAELRALRKLKHPALLGKFKGEAHHLTD